VKKHLDIEYMKAAVREALRVRSGIRAGGKGGTKPDKPDKPHGPPIVAMYGVGVPTE